MFNNRSGKNLVIFGLFLVILFMSVGFAALSSNLKIEGNTKIKGNSWNVHFTNLGTPSTFGAPTVDTEPSLDPTFTTLTYGVTLNQPGDSYSFTVDVINSGSIDAKLNSISNTGVSAEQDVYVNYTVTGINQNDVLAAGDSKTITVTIEYDSTVESSQLPTDDQTLTLTVALNFVQA